MNFSRKTAIVLLFFACAFVISFLKIPGRWLFAEVSESYLRILYNYLLGCIPLLIALVLLGWRQKSMPSLGLRPGGIGRGLLFAAVAVLPMFAGAAITGKINSGLTAEKIVTSVVIAGFFEELFFRGFLFGLLFRYCRWGFIPALLINGIPFGLLHLYQEHDLLSSLAVFGATAAGALLFSWLYAEWRYNLWVPVFMHMLMNLSWTLFIVSPDAAGGWSANLFRFATVVLAVAATIWYKARHHIPYEITWRTMLHKR